LIFSNASSNNSFLNPPGANNDHRTTSAPLQPGDYVDLGKMKGGTTFSPFLISNGANGGTSVFTANANNNSDQIQHFVAMNVTTSANHSYVLFGVEDLKGGGDRDFNDVVFALDVGAGNARHLGAASVPLPSSVLALAGPMVCCLWTLVRRKAGRRAQAN